MSDATFSSSLPLTNAGTPAASPQLRLWPALLLVLVQWPLLIAPIYLVPGTMTQFLAMFWGPMVVATLFVLWWLFASRAPWLDRIVVLGAFAAFAVATYFLAHESFRMGLILYGLPLVTTLWAVWLAVSSALSWPTRRVGLLAVLLLGWGACTLVRFNGTNGAFVADLDYRFSPTAEDGFLAGYGDGKPSPEPAEKVVLAAGDWPGFRGADRDGKLSGYRIDTDWTTPPKELWRRKLGPGWSSFAVVGDRLYTAGAARRPGGRRLLSHRHRQGTLDS